MTEAATEVKYLEECLSKSDPSLMIEVMITTPVNDDVPDGFIESSMERRRDVIPRAGPGEQVQVGRAHGIQAVADNGGALTQASVAK